MCIIILGGVATLYLSVYLYWFIVYYRQGKRRKKLDYKIQPPKKWWYKLFYEFPKYLIKYWYEKDPEEFNEMGLHIVAGEQGRGKTVTTVYLLQEWKRKFPKLKIATNYYYQGEDYRLNNWEDIVFKNNGIYGQVDVIDEIVAWFNSLESKDFPPEMLSEISMQRKQHKVILGTAQVWDRVAKPIREQTYYLYKPYTFFNCLTITLKFRVKSSGKNAEIEKLLFRDVFFFVQTDEIRNAFDTFLKIKTQSLKGWKKRNEQIGWARVSEPRGDEAG